MQAVAAMMDFVPSGMLAMMVTRRKTNAMVAVHAVEILPAGMGREGAKDWSRLASKRSLVTMPKIYMPVARTALSISNSVVEKTLIALVVWVVSWMANLLKMTTSHALEMAVKTSATRPSCRNVRMG